MRNTWTPEQEETLETMRANGEKLVYIARALKKTLCNVSRKVCRDMETRPYKAWHTQEIELAKNLLKQGLNYRQIAEKLGRSSSTVKQKFYEERKRNEYSS